MAPSLSSIIIFKPTSFFLHLLNLYAQTSEPISLNLLQVDCAGYVFPNYEEDEQMIADIKQHASQIFTNEMRRWLGHHAITPTLPSFLDFCCCFEFKRHAHLVLMEPTIAKGKALIHLKPTWAIYTWIKSLLPQEHLPASCNLTQLSENSTLVIKNFIDLAHLQAFLRKYYKVLAQAEFARMTQDKHLWPSIHTLSDFWHFFSIDIHTYLVHL